MRSFAGIPIRVIRKGTVLYHGTSRRYGFRDLEGPAWVTESIETARWFARWKYDEREPQGEFPRIMAFRVVASIPLPTIHADQSYLIGRSGPRRDLWRHFSEAIEERSGIRSAGAPDAVVEGVCALGLHGWNLVGNYRGGGSDIVLCDPMRWLRRIRAGRDRIAGM